MKIFGIAVGLVVVLAAAFSVYANYYANPRAEAEIRADPQGERAARVMLLTLPDGRTLPVNYLREGAKVFAGADGTWWKELRGEGVEVEMWIQGVSYFGLARAIEDDPAYTADVFSRLRPTVPKWLPESLSGTLVEIKLMAVQS